MSLKCLRSLQLILLIAAVWAIGANTGLAGFHGHRRYPTGNSPTYPNATSPHGGFSSSNGYYSGRSRIVDAPPPPVAQAAAKPAPAK